MPRFNRDTGEALMGVGNGPLSVDGRLLRDHGGGPSAWYNRDVILHQINDQLAATNLRSNYSEIIGPGANEVSAGGTSSYLAWGGGVGLFGAITLATGGLNRVITDGRGANSADGCLVYIADRQGSGPTLVRHPNGTEAQLPDAYGLHVLRWGEACWNAGPGILDFWGTRSAYLPGAGYAKQVDLQGTRWLVYFLDHIGLIAHRGLEPDVYHLIAASTLTYQQAVTRRAKSGGGAFHHDAIAFEERLAVCFSRTSGEGPGDLVTVMDVAQCPTRPYEQPGVPPNREPIPLEQIVPLVGKWIDGWYELRGTPESQGFPLPPGNMEVAVRGYPAGTVRPRPLICTDEAPPSMVSPMALFRVGSEAADPEDDLATMMRKMEQRAWDLYEQGVQTCFYWDNRAVPFWPALPPDVIWEQQVYCGVTEPLDQFEAWLDGRCYELCERYPFVVLTAQTHTTNAALLAEPSEAIPPVQRALDRYRATYGERMAGLLVFNDAGRDDLNPASPTYGEGGLTANPQLRPHWERLFHGYKDAAGQQIGGVTGLPNVFSHGTPIEPPIEPPAGGDVVIVIFEHPPTVSRSDPKGLPIYFEVESDQVIVKLEVGLKNTYGDLAEKPAIISFVLSGEPDDKDGRYIRMLAWKPVREGTYHPYVTAWTKDGPPVTETAPTTVEVVP